MIHTSEKLKKLICPAAFQDFAVFKSNTTVCCPNWYDVDELISSYPEDFKPGKYPHPVLQSKIKDRTDLLSNWNNKFHKDLRESILDGNYRFCSKMCPHIDRVYNEPDAKDLYLQDKVYLEEHTGIDFNKPLPKRVYFNFDDACNLKCPTCRLEMVTNISNSDGHGAKLIETIERQLGPELEEIAVTGSGDPFYSNLFREWLHNFDKRKFPKLKGIFINTNGIMWTPKLWEYIKPVHPYITGTEWSIDAATKHTYENVSRLNGKWDKILENMDFVSTLNVKNLVFSFVVREETFEEMEEFCELIESKFNVYDFDNPSDESTATIMFRAMQHWGHQSQKWHNERDICNIDHPRHRELLPYIEKVHKYSFVNSNLRHLVSAYREKYGSYLI